MDNVLLGVLVTSQLLYTFHGFNIDVTNPNIYEGPQGSRFGYSLAQLSTSTGQRLLVGAPSSRHSQYVGGDVYMCDEWTNDPCQRMDFHEDDLGIFRGMSNRTEQWLGATIATSGDTDGSVLACAPRMWIHSLGDYEKGYMIGGCYVLKQDSQGKYSQRTRYDPCVKDENKNDLKELGLRMCQSGFSAALHDEKVIMGCPSSFAGQGQLMMQEVGGESVLMKSLHTISQDKSLSYTYNGFTMAVGVFNKEKVKNYVSASPKTDMIGAVNIYKVRGGTLSSYLRLIGEQPGEYFGYSLAVGDFNGDRLDDLAVGSPMYSDYKRDIHEIGRVYVYHQSQQLGLEDDYTVLQEPVAEKSRFGLAVANAGDLNYDSYGDLVVGAPYGGKDNRGAVYVYYGSISGIRSTVSQVIHGADFDQNSKLFGFSLTGGLDQDRNGYKDIAVGAFGSDKAFSLKSRPVVRFSLQMKMDTNIVDLQKQDCTSASGRPVSCFTFEPCISFKGYNAPNMIEFTTTISLDVGKTISKRAFFENEQNSPYTRTITKRMRKNAEINCLDRQTVHISNTLRDKLSPITMKMTSRIVEETLEERRGIKAVQNQFTPDFITEEVHILKSCGPDDVCIPDLVLDAKQYLDKITYGKDTAFDLSVYVLNQGEDSFETKVYMEFPRGINYINVKVEEAVTAVACAAAEIESVNSLIICYIGNPLPANKKVTLTVKTSIGTLPVMGDHLLIKVNVNSTNPELKANMVNNQKNLTVDLAAEVELQLQGVSAPKELLYNFSAYSPDPKSLEEFGPLVTHLYQLINNGPSKTQSTIVDILWPSFSTDSANLMYLVSATVLRADRSCCHGSCTSKYINIDKLNSTMAKVKRDADETRAKVVCQNSNHMCVVIVCKVNALRAKEHILIEVDSRVSYNAIDKMDGDKVFLQVASSAKTRDTVLPYDTKDIEIKDATFQIKTDISASDPAASKPVAWWIILVAVLAGVLLLCLVGFILYKCGFFKRKIKEDMKRLTVIGASGEDVDDETEPMNNNADSDNDGL